MGSARRLSGLPHRVPHRVRHRQHWRRRHGPHRRCALLFQIGSWKGCRGILEVPEGSPAAYLNCTHPVSVGRVREVWGPVRDGPAPWDRGSSVGTGEGVGAWADWWP